MSETNGQGKSRLDRIEEMIERHERANEAAHQRFLAENEAAHQRFEEEDKRLLTSQILMNDAMQKMLGAVERMADGMKSLELKMEETTEKLNALIETVDGIIRKKAE